MDFQKTALNLVVLVVLGAAGYYVYEKLVDRTDEIVAGGDETSGRVTYVAPDCRRKERSIRVRYNVSGVEQERQDDVECAWEVPSIVTVVYLPFDTSQARVLSPERARKRVAGGR